MATRPDDLAELTEAVLASRKYRRVAPSLIRSIGAAELDKGRSTKEAIKATKGKLHQTAGAYQSRRMPYDGWLDDLRQTVAQESPQSEVYRSLCREAMGYHASSRERLPLLDTFYPQLLAELPPLRSVLDVACGLNPLAIPWMPLAPGFTYWAYDIYSDQIDFLNQFFCISGLSGRAEVRDVLNDCPLQKADVAFVLKTIPCLEQVDAAAGTRLLANLRVRHLIVSFPAQSLGGRKKGMPANYETHFRELVADRPWTVRRFLFASELVFLVDKSPP